MNMRNIPPLQGKHYFEIPSKRRDTKKLLDIKYYFTLQSSNATKFSCLSFVNS